MNNQISEYRRQRYFILSHVRQVRMMLRDGRQVTDCKKIIKDAQKDMAYLRRTQAKVS